jgi:CRP-like cAMP-binding protein
VGGGSAVDRLPTLATVTTVGQVSAVAIAATRFRALIEESPDAAVALARALALQARESDRARIAMVTRDAVSRVADRLLELEEVRARERNAVDLQVTQDELAGWVGVTRTTVARALRVLRDEGLVSTRRQAIIVHDRAGLRDRAAS